MKSKAFLSLFGAFFLVVGIIGMIVKDSVDNQKAVKAVVKADEVISKLHDEMEVNLELADREGSLVLLSDEKLSEAGYSFEEAQKAWKESSNKENQSKIEELSTKLTEIKDFQEIVVKALFLDNEINLFKASLKENKKNMEDEFILLKTTVSTKSQEFKVENNRLKEVFSEKYINEVKRIEADFK